MVGVCRVACGAILLIAVASCGSIKTTADAAVDPIDAAAVDASELDAAAIDASPLDATEVDAALLDAAAVDAVPIDAVPIDAVPIDAVPIDARPPPTSCADALAQTPGAFDGPYTIDPGTGPFTVYCDMTTAGGGWTMIMNKLGDFPGTGWVRHSTTATTPHLRSTGALLADNQDLLTGIPGTRLMFVSGERNATSRASISPALGAALRTFYDSIWGVGGRWCGIAPVGTTAFELLYDSAALDCYTRVAPNGGYLETSMATTPAGAPSPACFGGPSGPAIIGDAATDGASCATHVFLGSGACGCGDTFTRVFIR